LEGSQVTHTATLHGRVVTDRPDRYIKQLCQHAAAMGRRGKHQFKAHGADTGLRGQVSVDATWNESTGSIDFKPWGRCELRTVAGGFDVRIDADSPAHLRLIADRLERNIDRFGKGRVPVQWAADRGVPRGRRALVPLAVGGLVVALVAAAHVGVGGLLFERWPWSVGTLALLVAVKVGLVFFVGRRRHATR